VLKIERDSIHVDKDTWFYVNRKSLYMVHWQELDGARRCSSFKVRTKLLRSVLSKLAAQAAKERATRRKVSK
jgi:hypothetical protein